jgi:hypothetical protein
MSRNSDNPNDHLLSPTIADSTSPLLRLPRELRDEIYTYALYEPNGVYFHREDVDQANFSTSPHENQDINPLQSTCRQLRAETFGLEWEFNEFIFYCDEHRNGTFMKKNPAAQFLGFLEMCTETWRQRVRHVSLLPYTVEACENNPLLLQDLHLIMCLCERYPLMTVRWHLELLPHACGRSTLEAFLHNGLVFAESVRANFQFDKARNKELDFRPWFGGLTLYHKLWCKDPVFGGFSGCRRSQCENMIRAKNFRIILFKERFTESECEKTFAFEVAEADDDPEKKILDEKRLALAKEWWINRL